MRWISLCLVLYQPVNRTLETNVQPWDWSNSPRTKTCKITNLLAIDKKLVGSKLVSHAGPCGFRDIVCIIDLAEWCPYNLLC